MIGPLARGWTEIMTDSIFYVYEDALWEFTTTQAAPISVYGKYHLFAKLSDVKKLARKHGVKPQKD